jgi:Fe-S cluster assembly protein SufD
MSTLTETAPAKEAYLAAFERIEKELAQAGGPSLARQRRAAVARFGELGFPGPRNEDWKFTSVAPFVRTPFELPAADQYHPLADVRPPAEGVLVVPLGRALAEHPDLVAPHLGRHADFQNQPFAALNTAFWRDGLFVYVPPGRVVEAPINLNQRAGADNEQIPHLWYRRLLVVLGRGSQATLVEDYSGPDLLYATNAVAELVVGEGARLDHYKVQNESREAFHFASTQAVLAHDSNFSTHYVGLGGRLARNEVRVRFDGEGAEATVNGLYLASGTQHADNFTVIDHARPHCTSHELYKGILDGKARGVFNGKIYVRQDAQKTDAKQTNQTLLLSDDATINTKPQLEIYADDVKCTHGATVGQLSDEQTFYLRTRGIGLAEARALLTFAFANDVIGRIKVDSLRERLERVLLEAHHLPRVESEVSA